MFRSVVAAAMILDPTYRVRGLRDSKLLEPERREVLAERIREHSIGWSDVAAVNAARIDQINIYQASRVAMREAVLGLAPSADHLLIDAMKIECDVPQMAVIHRRRTFSVNRCRRQSWPKWRATTSCANRTRCFRHTDSHRTRDTAPPRHVAALREFGPTPLHRQSFTPCLAESGSAGGLP